MMAEFLAKLRGMPHLEQLYVHSFLPTTHEFSSSGKSQMINLSHLSYLSMMAPISTVNTFLSCVDIPLATKVELRLG